MEVRGPGRLPPPAPPTARAPTSGTLNRYMTALPDRRSPWRTLAFGVVAGLCTIAGIGAYTYTEVGRLRDEQTAISERNRKDSLQLLRIQNDLASLSVLMRDMI